MMKQIRGQLPKEKENKEKPVEIYQATETPKILTQNNHNQQMQF